MVLALIIAVVGVSAVSSIATTHLLRNSHAFRETRSDSGFCEECHPEQVEAMSMGSGHSNSQLSQCEFCHTGDGETHGAFRIQCESCHHDGTGGENSALYAHNGIFKVDSNPECFSCHPGAGIRPDMDQLAELTESAHSGMLDQNDPTVACISCHTAHESELDVKYNGVMDWIIS